MVSLGLNELINSHQGIITRNRVQNYWPFVRGIYWSPLGGDELKGSLLTWTHLGSRMNFEEILPGKFMSPNVNFAKLQQCLWKHTTHELAGKPCFWKKYIVTYIDKWSDCEREYCVLLVIGIDHDTVCAGVVGTAIRNSTSCAGRRAAACGRAGRHNECCSGLQYQPRQRRPYKWSISILPRSQFTKSKGNLHFRRLVPLFVPIGVCVTTHDDGTASDVTIGMWRHNQQVTNLERNGKPWFSLPK